MSLGAPPCLTSQRPSLPHLAAPPPAPAVVAKQRVRAGGAIVQGALALLVQLEAGAWAVLQHSTAGGVRA